MQLKEEKEMKFNSKEKTVLMTPQTTNDQKDMGLHKYPGQLIVYRDTPGTAAEHTVSRPDKIKGYENDQSHQTHYQKKQIKAFYTHIQDFIQWTKLKEKL